MRYLGGKVRQSREILDVVRALRGSRTNYVEPFVGGGSVFSRVAPEFTTATAGDVVPELIALWTAAVGGWAPSGTMTREEYDSLRYSSEPSAEKGWAAFAASYNGKYFSGYGPTASGRDYLAESKRALTRKVAGMSHATFVCGDFAAHAVDANTVVYCDPPYEGTEQYGAAKGFDHTRFWSVATEWADLGALVLVHEYAAPEGWTVAHERARVETMHHGGPSSGARMERIFTRGNTC